MANRVLLGNRGGEMGLWVSAPGKDVYSGVFEDLLVDTTRINTQPLIKGFTSGTTLAYDAGRTTGPTIGQNYAVNQTTGKFAWYAWAFPGTAAYSLTIPHNLGFIPLCHLSVMSDYGGTPYPNIFIDANNLVFVYYENWDAVNIWDGSTYQAVLDVKASAYTFNCDFHYTLFRQQAA